VILLIYHVVGWRFLVALRDDRDTRSHGFYRYVNEFPVLLLVAIVILVVVKP